MQRKEKEWTWQWQQFRDDNLWLFTEWISPNTLDTFRGKSVLDCGCGGGQHLRFIAPYAREAVGVDLNAAASAKKHTASLTNVRVQEADIATMDLGRTFNIVYSIGVLHHTTDPTASFRNITKHCAPGGKVIVWVYSHEGNVLQRAVIEPLKRLFLQNLPRPLISLLAHILTTLLYLPVYSLYLFTPRSLGEVGLPYFSYFQNWRKLSYWRNFLNVFDKLNAPETHFLRRDMVKSWFDPSEFHDIHISPYRGVSYRASGTKLL